MAGIEWAYQWEESSPVAGAGPAARKRKNGTLDWCQIGWLQPAKNFDFFHPRSQMNCA